MNEDPSGATDQDLSKRDTSELFRLAYRTLHDLAAAYLHHERVDHTLQPTALVHEAYLKLAPNAQWKNRAHFRAVAASAMRQVLVDHARSRATQKRGGQWKRVGLTFDAIVRDREIDLVALDDAMQALKEFDPRKCEVVELRFFGGLTNREAAEHLGISPKSAEADWYFSRAWLRERLGESEP